MQSSVCVFYNQMKAGLGLYCSYDSNYCMTIIQFEGKSNQRKYDVSFLFVCCLFCCTNTI